MEGYTYKVKTSFAPAHAMPSQPIYHPTDFKRPAKSSGMAALFLVPVVLLRVVADVEAKTLSVEVDLVVALLENGGNGFGVVELTQVDV